MSYGGSLSTDGLSLDGFLPIVVDASNASLTSSFISGASSDAQGLDLPADYLFALNWNPEDILGDVHRSLQSCIALDPAFRTAMIPVS